MGKKTPHFTITKVNWLTLFREVIVACTDSNKTTHKYKMKVY
jgi:hypothetical protein